MKINKMIKTEEMKKLLINYLTTEFSFREEIITEKYTKQKRRTGIFILTSIHNTDGKTKRHKKILLERIIADVLYGMWYKKWIDKQVGFQGEIVKDDLKKFLK